MKPHKTIHIMVQTLRGIAWEVTLVCLYLGVFATFLGAFMMVAR